MKKLIISLIFLTAIFSFGYAQNDSTIIEVVNLDSTEQTYFSVEQMPKYPGGTEELRKFIAENVIYPEENRTNEITGTVYAKFVVDKTGKVRNAEIMRGIDPVLDKEALRVINLLPDFTPGMQGGKPVDVWFTVPIVFKLD